jgi:hypothetical protein
MIENHDSESVYKCLEELDKLPADWSGDGAYFFENERDFYLVVYFVKRKAGRFILFRIEDFAKNFGELSSIMSALLCLEVEEEHHQVVEDALGEIHGIIAAGGTTTRFFDAH